MRAAEYELAGQVLDEVLTELRAEYVEQIIEATKSTDSVGVAAIAMRVVVLEDLVGTIVARAHETVPTQQPETDSE